MVANLLENARRYGRDQSSGIARVDLTVRAEGSNLLLEVRDYGKGVPAEARERMLRPFARLDQARGDQEGSGLGLAIVARIARRHGGDVALHEAPGGGLLVRLRLGKSS
jgi:two-component system osmolarity sensor histidine kinase EnvZ